MAKKGKNIVDLGKYATRGILEIDFLGYVRALVLNEWTVEAAVRDYMDKCCAPSDANEKSLISTYYRMLGENREFVKNVKNGSRERK